MEAAFHTVDRRRRRAMRCAVWAAFVAAAAALMGGLVLGGATWPAVTAGGLATLAGLAVGDRWMREPGGAPVLCYHSISDEGWVPWASCIVSIETFERHLGVLARGGFTVMRLRDLVAIRLAGGRLPPRPVAVTFDDGYLDNWVAALPLLRRHGIPATIFVSLDFIEEGENPRATLDDRERGRVGPEAVGWAGYLNWAELRAMQDGGVFDVLPHGVDHGWVETGPRVVASLSAENWRRLAWVQWRVMAGSKAGWYRAATPAFVPLGTPVRENAPALAARAWDPDRGLESDESYAARVRGDLERSKRELEERLGRGVDIFCWPNNGTNDTARAIAAEVGYAATTGGRGENRPGEDPRVISRLGVGDRIAGWRWPAAEALGMYAALRVFQGNYYWFYLLVGFAALRRLHGLLEGWRRAPTADLSAAARPVAWRGD
ncbi:MAG: polysaccharide deacetylase family protein [Rhodospirillales bacterium]|nr:polysaccharide deacetylase family protein [Rhodospirillales bacterium]